MESKQRPSFSKANDAFRGSEASFRLAVLEDGFPALQQISVIHFEDKSRTLGKANFAPKQGRKPTNALSSPPRLTSPSYYCARLSVNIYTEIRQR
jgi:hypothetical protein